MLQVHGLHYEISGNTILQDVNLQIRSGESAVILGPSGAGKSTLLKAIIGLVPVQRGTVTLDGLLVDSSHATAQQLRTLRKQVALVFQSYPMFAHKTVLQNIVEPLRLVHGVDRSKANALAVASLEKLRLQDKLHTYPHELSGGQKQRVSIARALTHQPKAILFDEPTSALDTDLVGEVVRTVHTLRGMGIAVVTVTHDPVFANRIATHTYRLANGRLSMAGGRVGSAVGV
ncbi:MAG: ATP-binding cassette domain-containing protein [Bifidobacterium animalis]|nr:ATP-binding cassette domain-containing protein [Bifidobacterium animalis]